MPPGQPIQAPSLARITGSMRGDQAAGGAAATRRAVGLLTRSTGSRLATMTRSGRARGSHRFTQATPGVVRRPDCGRCNKTDPAGHHYV